MNLLHFPITAGSMTDEELELQKSGALIKLLNENDALELERDVFYSAWRSAAHRLEGMQIRRLRLVILGAAAGAFGAWLLDGHVASYLNRLLNALGWMA